MDQPAWLGAAWAEFGVREGAGARDEARVVTYYREAGHGEVVHDEVPWCAAFAGAMLVRSGLKGTGSLMARSYLRWGEAIAEARLGAIAVLTRGSDPAAGHVGFVVGATAQHVYLLGGNQGDAVSVAAFEIGRLLGYRWPLSQDGEGGEAPGSGVASDNGFAHALAHVLEMEGGFSDDPYDPGGPTNRGITLATFARFKGVTVDGTSRARLIADLKRIADDDVARIYLERYWRPGQCDVLHRAAALFHFDACVNHGVAGAARMLQQACGVAADGDIGPQTLAAVAGKDAAALIDTYAAIRRARYRALPHFWRFGRGWLKRVALTESKAEALLRAPVPQQATSKGALAMEPIEYPNATDTAAVQGKWWAQSKTVWGALITAAATVVPVLGPLIGIELSGEVVRQAGEQTISAVQALAGLFGTLLTLYGRLKAAGPLTRKDVNVRL